MRVVRGAPATMHAVRRHRAATARPATGSRMRWCIWLALAAVFCAATAQTAQPLELHVVASPSAPPEHGGGLHYRSVTAARDALRAMQPLPPGGAKVVLHEGYHRPFALTTLDSGRPDAQITYVGREGAVVSGGLPLPPSAFQPWRAGPAGALQADLGKLGVTTAQLGSMRTAKMGCISDCQHDKAELFLGEQAMTLARYPNKAHNGSWQFLRAAVGGTQGSKNSWFLMNATSSDGVRIHSWASTSNRTAWLHGYWSFNAMDCYRNLVSASNVTRNNKKWLNVSFVMEPTNAIQKMYDRVKANARFMGVNILAELDAPFEYFIDEATLMLYFFPPATWSPTATDNAAELVLSVSGTHLIGLDNVKHVSLVNLTAAYGRWSGIDAQQVEAVRVLNCSVFAVGRDGIILNGTDSTISRCNVHDTGCGGIKTTGGNMRTLTPGNVAVRHSSIHHVSTWKRAYAPPLGFWGCSNAYEGNTVANVPHSGIIGNGVNMSFVRNTLDTNCFETSDVGAFYTDGEIGDRNGRDGNGKGDNFWSMRGSRVINNTFKNIVTQDPGDKIHGLAAQALYLDDMTSGYEVAFNDFINCDVGTFVGGGRDNFFHDNYYENCNLAQHIDNRGMNWDSGCNACAVWTNSSSCACTNGTGCAPAVAWELVNDPASAALVAAYPLIKTAVPPAHGGQDICVPVGNRFEDNTYCKCAKYLDADANTIEGWKSVARNNTELFHC